MTYALFFNLGKLFLENTPLNPFTSLKVPDFKSLILK